jgi:hypothetical protein
MPAAAITNRNIDDNRDILKRAHERLAQVPVAGARAQGNDFAVTEIVKGQELELFFFVHL